MSFDSESFFKLAKSLRKMGATRVEGYGFSVEFAPKHVAAPAQPTQLTLAQVPRRPPSRSPSPADAVPERFTPEQLADAKERAYARELGKF